MNGLPSIFQSKAQAPQRQLVRASMPPGFKDARAFIQAVNAADEEVRKQHTPGGVPNILVETSLRKAELRIAYQRLTGQPAPDMPILMMYVPEGKEPIHEDYEPDKNFIVAYAGPSGFFMRARPNTDSVLGKQAYSGEGPITGVKRARAGKRKTRKGRKSTKRRSTRK